MRSSKSRSRNKSRGQRTTLGNVVNRVFDSSGPEGKVRGTPQQIIEKYLALARDAQLSGDRVAEQSFFQHAEHYTRMLGEAQREQAERQQQSGQQGQGGSDGEDRQQGGNQGQNGNGGSHDRRPDQRAEQRSDQRRDDRDGERRENRRDDRRDGRRDDGRDARAEARADATHSGQAGDQQPSADPALNEYAPGDTAQNELRIGNEDSAPAFLRSSPEAEAPDEAADTPATADAIPEAISTDSDDSEGPVATPEAETAPTPRATRARAPRAASSTPRAPRRKKTEQPATGTAAEE